MKKNGFSLAEILLALTIIGVAAALAIPSLVTKTSRQAEASKLSSIVADLENAFTNIMSDTDSDDLFADGVLTSDNLKKHLNYKNSSDNLTSLGYSDASPFYIIKASSKHDTCTINAAYVLKNNAVVCLCSATNTCTTGDICAIEKKGKRIIIDTDGADSNNRAGRDVYDFAVGTTGKLYPRGSKNYEYLMGNSSSTPPNCQSEGKGCAQRLIKNNYKVDY